MENKSISLFGHPFSPIGMGEHVRSNYNALKSVGIKPYLCDIYNMDGSSAWMYPEYEVTNEMSFADINIWHINGDEIPLVFRNLSSDFLETSYNIIFPMWELAKYPLTWVKELDLFNEIWAPSKFVGQSIASVAEKPVHIMPLACQPNLTEFYSRRYFGLPEQHFLFLAFWDDRSYIQRKNPSGVVKAFQKFKSTNQYALAKLVLKVNPLGDRQFNLSDLGEFDEIEKDIILIDKLLSDQEMKNLIRNCDCFVSLHRSEGFGRGMSEAAFWGKCIIATGYSGNMDYLNEENCHLVPFELVEVKKGEYPHWQGQRWADPLISQAAEYMGAVYKNPEESLRLGRRALEDITYSNSYFSVGQKIADRINEIEV